MAISTPTTVVQVLDNIVKDSALSKLFQQANRNVPNSRNGDMLVLNQQAIDYYYRKNRVLQKIIVAKPMDGTKKMPKVIPVSGEINQEQLFSDFQEIPAYGRPLEELTPQTAIQNTGIYGNLYGDGLMFLGVNDGLPPEEPVDLNRVQGISWMIVRHRYQVGVDYMREGYRILLDARQSQLTELNEVNSLLFHHTRVVRIPGIPLYGRSLEQNGGFNDSIIQAVYREWDEYCTAVLSSSNMLRTHSLFKYKLQGLATLLRTNKQAELQKRFEGIMSSISALGGLVYDASSEDADFINRSYGGADKLALLVLNWFMAAADTTYSRIFGTPGSTALSEGGRSEERLWNDYVNQYQHAKLSPAYKKIFTYLLAARNNTTGFLLKYAEHHPLPPLDAAEVNRRNAIAAKIYADLGMDLNEVLENILGVKLNE